MNVQVSTYSFLYKNDWLVIRKTCTVSRRVKRVYFQTTIISDRKRGADDVVGLVAKNEVGLRQSVTAKQPRRRTSSTKQRVV